MVRTKMFHLVKALLVWKSHAFLLMTIWVDGFEYCLSDKSKMCASLHNDNLQKAGVKGLHSITTDKAPDAMAFARKLRYLRSSVYTKLVFWQSGWQQNLKCVLEVGLLE